MLASSSEIPTQRNDGQTRFHRAEKITLFVLVQIVVCVVALEVACQIYAAVLARRWEDVKSDPAHFYRESENPVLTYELVPGYATLAEDGRVLVVNRHGLRDIRHEFEGEATIALIGDSVTFGQSHSQGDTISAKLEKILVERGHSWAVANLGVPGYAVAEIAEQQRVKDSVYDFGAMVYLFNPNDFARRESRFEGADNGLYRMYRQPTFKSPWFVRKAIYRLARRGVTDFATLRNSTPGDLMVDNTRNSVEWYRWLLTGNANFGLAHLEQMINYAKRELMSFGVVFLPVRSGFADDGFGLTDEYGSLSDFLSERGVPCRDPTPDFEVNPRQYFDGTDHLTPAGNALVAQILADFIETEILPRENTDTETSPSNNTEGI